MRKCYLSNEEINALVGTQVGSWTVLSYLNKEYDMTQGGMRVRHWYLCKCTCGIVRPVRRDSLIQHNSCSCGHNRHKNFGKL